MNTEPTIKQHGAYFEARMRFGNSIYSAIGDTEDEARQALAYYLSLQFEPLLTYLQTHKLITKL